MGNGAFHGLPEDVNEEMAAAALGSKWNVIRWREIVNTTTGTIKLTRLQAECSMSHNYPVNKTNATIEFNNGNEDDDVRVEQVEASKKVGRLRNGSTDNYPPNHPKSRSRTNSASEEEEQHPTSNTSTAVGDQEAKENR